mmetsp:Transcript_40621/g.36060  ORF Transcript_40621/g.36060 Transcript_40621/m.36060 type:complete len:134 (+) Transcript_40621:751-1152(+)
MIGIQVQIIHKDYKDGFLDNSFFNNKTKIWLAPPQGLMLNKVTFEAYNRKKDIPESLELNTQEEEHLEDFKRKIIYPSVIEAEKKDKSFSSWLEEVISEDKAGRMIEESSDEGEDGKSDVVDEEDEKDKKKAD